MTPTPKEAKVALDLQGVHEPIRLQTGHHRVVVTCPRLLRPEDTPLATFPGSCLCVPGPPNGGKHVVPYFLSAIERALERTDAVVFVLGHASTQEQASLAGERSRAVRALVEDDPEAWVELATASGSLRDVKAYFAHLSNKRGWPCPVEFIDEVDDESAKTSVAAFQQAFNQRFRKDILVDGVCGPQTLGAVFAVLRDEYSTWMHDRGLSADAIRAIDVRYQDSSDADRTATRLAELGDQPGLDILIVDKASLPAEPTATLLYTTPYAQVDTYPAHYHFVDDDVVVRLDLRGADPRALPHAARLRETSGRFDQTLPIDAQASAGGPIDLNFRAVPSQGHYTLTLSFENPARVAVIAAGAEFRSLLDDRLPMQEGT